MKREEYLNELRKYLKRLPQEDYENAMEYFTEYFAEAGPEGEDAIIEELGTPKEAANELLNQLLDEKTESLKTDKRKTSIKTIILIVILAIFAAPIGIPMALVFVVLLFVLLIVLFLLLFSAALFGVGFMALGIKAFIRGIIAFATSAAGGAIVTGIGIAAVGAGILVLFLSYYLCKWIGIGIFHFVRTAIHRKGGNE
ncbi:MAG: DUF1700 domain-containing protein [Lachnospiraceae bacterium]|nr:DUF1700 domain-containing protein [Lachnospiraceae bacterium]